MKQFSLDEYLKNPSMKVVTRDGRDVRIICTDFNNKIYPIVGEIQGVFTPEPFTKDGAYREVCCTDYDLFFAPEKHERWVNLYKSESGEYSLGAICTSKKQAEVMAGGECIATCKIEWEE